MTRHSEIEQKVLMGKIKRKEISFAGNTKLKIFGALQCKSGKRMKKEHRVFFQSQSEATDSGYRPCGHCMKEAYGKWKAAITEQNKAEQIGSALQLEIEKTTPI